MSVQRAVATSLVAVTLVSLTGVAAHMMQGQAILLSITSGFVAGGLVGLLLASWIARRLSDPMLQRVFAMVILIVGGLVIANSVR